MTLQPHLETQLNLCQDWLHMQLTLNSHWMYQDNDTKYGITPQTQDRYTAQIDQAIATVEKKLDEKAYGFVNILSDQQMVKQMRQLLACLRWAKALVVVGIGGSDLGGRMLQEALDSESAPLTVFFHGDSTDPTAIARLLQRIELDETIFCIISKSGETIETISQYVFFKEVMKKKTDDWSEHFVFITDAKKGILRTEADLHDIPTLAIPDDVGGRFSVQTTVGLLPALAMGIDIDQFLSGAQDAVEHHRAIAQEIARMQFLLFHQGITVNILMSYSVQLQEFGRWYRQLWAESLGKDGTGILPIKADGPADQHSQLQFYISGKLQHAVLFLRVEHPEEDFPIEDVDVQGVEYLEGLSFQQILLSEQTATAQALHDEGRPCATLTIDRVTAYSLGQLCLVFELAVVYLAQMLEVNAFDQPDVEKGKKIMYTLLKK